MEHIRQPPYDVRIVEVGPRDGLQNIQPFIPTSTKLELISRLTKTGLKTIELTSIVSPRVIPQLSDCRQILSDTLVQSLLADSSAEFHLPVLVPSLKGLQTAIENGVREVAIFVSASDGFSKANINCTVEESLVRARNIAETAHYAGLDVRTYVSCIFEDPFDGPVPPSQVASIVGDLLDMGFYEVSLGDTLGAGTPKDVCLLLENLVEAGVSVERLAGHFHDTYGQAVANAWEAYQHGLQIFDSSIAGLGGCPYCPGASGNVATEDLVFMFERAGISTGVDLHKLAAVGEWISNMIAVPYASRAGSAILAKQYEPRKRHQPLER